MIDYNSATEREWWSQQWLDLLDKYPFKKRLERARNYARQGNVLNIEFKDKKVLAQVQGTQPEPYQVSLWLDTFSEEEWKYVIEAMSQQAIFSAKLLAGEMPQNIEDVFATNGLRLFPFKLEDVHAHCSCPDQKNPCKHIGAIYYMLGDRFSEDPFVLFQLRGCTQEEIIKTLRHLRGNEGSETPSKPIPESSSPVNLYPVKVADYWHYAEPLEPSLVVITPPPSDQTVLDVLGSIPLAPIASTQGGDSASASDVVMQYLDAVYKNISQQAVLIALNREETSNSESSL